VVGDLEKVKFLTGLLSLLSLLFSEWVRARAKQEGRDNAQEQLDANVRKAEAVEAAVDADDLARVDRLRNRFDRNRG
jgi:hypothetical protein